MISPRIILRVTSSTTAVDHQHLKVKEKDINLAKTNCITISIEKISSFQKFILKIQQILGSHELKSHGIFDHAHPKYFWSDFNFCEFVSTCKNSVIQSVILQIQSILESHQQTSRSNFWPRIPSFLWICISMQKMRSIFSEEIVGLKILQSDWLSAFWPISQEQDFY